MRESFFQLFTPTILKVSSPLYLQIAEKDENSRILHAAQQTSAELRTTILTLQRNLDAANKKLTTFNEERTAGQNKLLVVAQKNEDAARALSAAKSEIQALTAARAELQKQYESLNRHLKMVNERLLLSTQEKNELQAQVRKRTAFLLSRTGACRRLLELTVRNFRQALFAVKHMRNVLQFRSL